MKWEKVGDYGNFLFTEIAPGDEVVLVQGSTDRIIGSPTVSSVTKQHGGTIRLNSARYAMDGRRRGDDRWNYYRLYPPDHPRVERLKQAEARHARIRKAQETVEVFCRQTCNRTLSDDTLAVLETLAGIIEGYKENERGQTKGETA